MKRCCVTFVLLLLLVQAMHADEKKFVIDPVHSGISFRIRHFYTMLPGRFEGFSGTITCDTNDLSSMKVHGSVDVSSISTANADRDKHLRSKDFFDVQKYPMATFDSREVRPGPDNSLSVRGVMTLHGIALDVVFEGKVFGYGPAMKGKKRVGYQGKYTLDRTKFGINYNALLTGGTTVLDIEAVEVDVFPEQTLGAQLQQVKKASEKDMPPDIAAALDEAKAKIAALKYDLLPAETLAENRMT